MAGTFALNSILGIYIILALVVVTGKQNSASGHAPKSEYGPRFLPRIRGKNRREPQSNV